MSQIWWHVCCDIALCPHCFVQHLLALWLFIAAYGCLMLAFHHEQRNELPAVNCSHKPHVSWAVVNLSENTWLFQKGLIRVLEMWKRTRASQLKTAIIIIFIYLCIFPSNLGSGLFYFILLYFYFFKCRFWLLCCSITSVAKALLHILYFCF